MAASNKPNSLAEFSQKIKQLKTWFNKLHINNYDTLIIVGAVLLAINDENLAVNPLETLLLYPDGNEEFSRIVNRFIGTDKEKLFRDLLTLIVNIITENPDRDYLSALYAAIDKKMGIVFTPPCIGELMCIATRLQAGDRVYDPTCGTGALLKAAHAYLVENNISNVTVSGNEQQDHLAKLANINISTCAYNGGVRHGDFFTLDTLDDVTVGLINPPYSMGHGTGAHLYELGFVLHLLDKLPKGAMAAALIPNRSLVGVQTAEKKLKTHILAKHSLNGVIFLHPQIFWPHADISTSLAVFTAHVPHDPLSEVLFIDFSDSGYSYSSKTGWAETDDNHQRLDLFKDTWNNRKIVPDFSFLTTITDTDEWIYPYFYTPTKPPGDAVFEQVVAKYLQFQVDMTLQGRGYLFADNHHQQTLSC